MDRDKLQHLLATAESGLTSTRSGLLIVAQSGDPLGLALPRRDLVRLSAAATECGLGELSELIDATVRDLSELPTMSGSVREIAVAGLDRVTMIEAAIWHVRRDSDPFPDDVSGFIDSSFNELIPVPDDPGWTDQDFEIDDETLEIFRGEADDLLSGISHSLEILARSPNDQNALWDIRRNSHTLKGAAGIVGLTEAAAISHRMEDLLDQIVELRLAAEPPMIAFLRSAASRLTAIVSSRESEDGDNLDSLYSDAITSISSESIDLHPHASEPQRGQLTPRTDTFRPAAAPIVRVSLDRLDELVRISRSLIINRSALAERFTELSPGSGSDSETLAKLGSIFGAQRVLTDELHAKLLRIRMVRFGTLETRLNRAVHVTCLDEKKKARIEIENGDVEIDTRVIDGLIEPLLHLLKNAVVHGIEPPEMRRLIGKADTGTIRISVEADEEAVVLSVADDGAGILIPKLKEKAIANGSMDSAAAAVLGDREAAKLIFDRGLTTAEKIDLNAGRGVGMSIVKESVESHGGSVLVESEPGRGTTFTLLLPLTTAKAEPIAPEMPDAQVFDLPPLALVVDDSASIRRQTAKILETAGLRVITANNGAEALELLLNGTFEPALILSDIEMPQIDGWEFLEYVKTDDNLGHIPMVMISSLNAADHRERALGLGASDYLQKPFNDTDLAKILETVGLGVPA